jgi:hypothetical protein
MLSTKERACSPRQLEGEGLGETPPLKALSARLVLMALLAVAAVACLGAAPAMGALPDNRAYEVVSPTDKNAVQPGGGLPSIDGSVIDWEAIGACCGAPTSAVTLFQSERQSTGWLTSVLTPTPPVPLVGLFQEQAPMDMNDDLSQAIFITPAPYDPGDDDDGALDLYRTSTSGGPPVWISQGSVGGTAESASTLGLATRDFNHIAFTSNEALTPDAASQPLSGDSHSQYLYLRDVQAGTTTLINVDDSGNLVDPAGAVLGNAQFVDNQYIPANFTGTSRNAVSDDGSKVFFETPPENSFACCNHKPHLYMRDLSTDTTTALDDPSQVDVPAQYEGASDNGSLVFFTTTQALDGADPTAGDNELYGYNTNTLTRFRVSAGNSGTETGNVVGETAISNDGSHVFFIARSVLASNTNSQGASATADQPNFYDYDTTSGTTTFIATLADGDGGDLLDQFGARCCLNAQPDVNRPAVPTADGSVLVFASTADLTGENSSGFAQIYRYVTSSGDLVCISCPPPGVDATRAASLGAASGGAYGPLGVPMTSDGSTIFFQSPDPLLPGDLNSDTPPGGPFGFLGTADVYEWKNGNLFLISDGRSPGSTLGSTNPSGSDVTISTTGALVPQDVDGFSDIYDARVNGGIPAQQVPPPCLADACKPPSSPPPTDTTPGTSGFVGPGNQPKNTTQSQPKKKKKKCKGKKCKKNKNARRAR